MKILRNAIRRKRPRWWLITDFLQELPNEVWIGFSFQYNYERLKRTLSEILVIFLHTKMRKKSTVSQRWYISPSILVRSENATLTSVIYPRLSLELLQPKHENRTGNSFLYSTNWRLTIVDASWDYYSSGWLHGSDSGTTISPVVTNLLFARCGRKLMKQATLREIW